MRALFGLITVLVLIGAPDLSRAAEPGRGRRVVDAVKNAYRKAYHRVIGRHIRMRKPTPADFAAVRDATRGLKIEKARFSDQDLHTPQIATWRDKKNPNIVHQQSQVLIKKPLAELSKIIEPRLWSTYLPFRPGGKVVKMKGGNMERMVLVPLDMSKYVTFSDNRIDWSVKASRRSIWTALYKPSVRMDDGFIEFQDKGDSTLVVARSKHDISMLATAPLRKLGLKKAAGWIHEKSLGFFWKRAFKRYQDYGEGRRAPRQPKSGEVVNLDQ